MLNKRSKNIHSSLKELEAAAFEVVNFQEPNVTLVIPENLTLTSDTKKGVLGGSVAAVVGDYLVGAGTHEDKPAGLFVNDAIPDNFVNAPALASNKVALALFGGEYEIDVFETHWYSDLADHLAAYTANADLYCSPSGLVTAELPTTADNAVGGTGVDAVLARVTFTPTSTNLVLALDLLA